MALPCICSPEFYQLYLVRSAQNQAEITVVMHQKDEQADQPLVRQVAEDDQKDWKTMMQCVLEEASLGADEQMAEKASKVLTKLADVKDFHLKGDVQDLWTLRGEYERRTESSEPSGHKASTNKDFVAPNWTDDIVNDRITPLN